MSKAEKSLISARTLSHIENYDDATALTYYSMYYAALAILYRCGIKSENHAATAILLREICGIETKDLEEAKKERVDKQYYVDFSATREDVLSGIRTAEEFNATINDRLSRMSRQQIEDHRRMAEDKLS